VLLIPLTPRPSTTALILFLLAVRWLPAETSAVVPHPADWPTFRQNPHLTGRSPLRGDLETTPRVVWRHDLGAQTVPGETFTFADFDGDREHETLVAGTHSLALRDADGTTLWELRDIPQPTIVQFADFAGNGSQGIIYWTSDGVTATYAIIDCRTGVRTELFTLQNSFGFRMRYGSILPGVKGMQVCVFWTGDPMDDTWSGQAYLWSFAEGCDRPQLEFEAHPNGLPISPLIAFDDYNGDGVPDLYAIAHEHATVWDMTTGEMLLHGPFSDNIIRTYSGILAIEHFPDRDHPSLLIVNRNLPGAYVVDLVGDKPVRRWKKVVGPLENQYQTAVEIEGGAPDPFRDIDGDGVPEFLLRVKNEHDDGQTRLVVLRAEDGRRLYDGPPLEIISVDELDGNTPPEILIQADSRLELAHWNGEGFATVWTAEGAQPVFEPATPLQDPTRYTFIRAQFSNPVVWKDSAADHTFFLRTADGIRRARLDGAGAVTLLDAPAADHPVTGFIPEAERMTTVVRGAEGVTEIVRGGEVIGQIPGTTLRRYLPPPPLVGELGGATRIVARTNDARVISLTPAGESGPLLAQACPTLGDPFADKAFFGLLADIDADGANEFLCSTEHDGAAVIAVDADGREQLRLRHREEAGNVILIATGRKSGSTGNWIATRWQTREKSWGTLWYATAFDAISGEALWERSNYGKYGEEPLAIGIHVPTAVVDYNGDGGDDLIVACANNFGIIDGTTGADLYGPKNMLDNRPDGIWPAYSKPILADLDGVGTPELIHAMSFASTYVATWESDPLWSIKLTRDRTARRYPGIADLDGDGTRELITSQQNGLLIACNHQVEDGAKRERWQRKLAGPVNDITAIDLDDDGRDELLVGSADGRLHALKEIDGEPRTLWTVSLEGAVGSPVVADLDGKGRPSILVPTDQGYLYRIE